MSDLIRSVTAQINKWLRPKGGEQSEQDGKRNRPESHARSESQEGGGSSEGADTKAEAKKSEAKKSETTKAESKKDEGKKQEAKKDGSKKDESKKDETGSGEKSELQKNMEKALEMKKQAGSDTNIPEHRTSHDGMQPNPNEQIAPSGAFEAEGNTPQLSRSHGVRKSDKG